MLGLLFEIMMKLSNVYQHSTIPSTPVFPSFSHSIKGKATFHSIVFMHWPKHWPNDLFKLIGKKDQLFWTSLSELCWKPTIPEWSSQIGQANDNSCFLYHRLDAVEKWRDSFEKKIGYFWIFFIAIGPRPCSSAFVERTSSQKNAHDRSF